jgi:hypothetical protein
METNKPLPRIRAAKLSPGAKNESVQSADIRKYDTLMAIVTSASRLRSRCDGLDARVTLLESMLERQGR